jgi:hypothetical protein
MYVETELFERPIQHPTAHWSGQSEQFATGEVLHTLLLDGAHIAGVVFMQEKPLNSGRRDRIYLVTLHLPDGDAQRLSLVENPYVSRLLAENGAQVIRMNWRKDAVRPVAVR